MLMQGYIGRQLEGGQAMRIWAQFTSCLGDGETYLGMVMGLDTALPLAAAACPLSSGFREAS